ncbi:MAG: flippase-like domain-containing protein [Candidatus Omnitrophica bacterium]|nr:flippase-like domain-containing protein [Candidatus Omnitrophota bacterium]
MRTNYPAIIMTLKGANPYIFCLALFVFIGAITLASLRLKIIIGSQDISININFLEALSLTFIGYFFNNFLPTTIGGDVVKGYYLAKKTGETLHSFASVFVDRVIGLLTMIIMAFVIVTFAGRAVADNMVRWLIYIIMAFSAAMILFMTNKKATKIFSVVLFFLRPIEEKLKRIYNAISGYRHHKALIFQSFFISIISQLLFFMCLGTLAMSIGSPIPIIDILLRMPIISILSLLPSINGLGLREGSTVVFFGPIIGKENAFAVSILWLLVLFVTSIIGGVIYGLSPQFKIKFKEIAKEEVLI